MIYHDVSQCIIMYHNRSCNVISYKILSYPVTQHCKSQNVTDMECYYEPLTKCTIADALRLPTGESVSIQSLPFIGWMDRAEENDIVARHAGDGDAILHYFTRVIEDPFDLLFLDISYFNGKRTHFHSNFPICDIHLRTIGTISN